MPSQFMKIYKKNEQNKMSMKKIKSFNKCLYKKENLLKKSDVHF